MQEHLVGYKTGSGNKMPLWVYGVLIPREDVPTCDNPGDFCATELAVCGGFNGGCPPYAPLFEKVKPGKTHFYTLIVGFDMASSLHFAGWRKGKSVPGLFILMYADRLTMNYIQRMLKFFEAERFYTLGASNCPGCNPKDCTVTDGKRCSKPSKRRFSLEATGVQCDELHYDLFEEVLPWWYRTKEHIPCWMFRYAGLFCNEDEVSQIDELLIKFVQNDWSYVPEVKDYSVDYVIDMLTVPEGKPWCPMSYEAYRIPIEEMGNA